MYILAVAHPLIRPEVICPLAPDGAKSPSQFRRCKWSWSAP